MCGDRIGSRPPAFSFEREEDRLGLLVRVSGALELQSSRELQEFLEGALLSCPMGRRVLVDLGEVSYISSSGVGALMNAVTLSRKRGVGLAFRPLPHGVSSVLEVLGVLDFLSLEDDHA